MPYPIYPSQPPAPTFGLLMQKLMKPSLVQILLPDIFLHSISSLLTFGCGGGLHSDRASFKAILVFSLLTGFSKSHHISKGLTFNHCSCMLNRLLNVFPADRSENVSPLQSAWPGGNVPYQMVHKFIGSR